MISAEFKYRCPCKFATGKAAHERFYRLSFPPKTAWKAKWRIAESGWFPNQFTHLL